MTTLGVMTDSSMLPPAAWYADPQDPASLRYWDGSQWTDQTRPLVAPEPVAPQPVAVAEPVQVQPIAVQSVEVQPVPQVAVEQVVAEPVLETPVETIAVQPAVQETVAYGVGSDQMQVSETVVDQPIAFAQSADTGLYPGFAAEVAALQEVEEAAVATPDVLVVTTESLPGHRVVSVCGPVVAVAVRAHSDLVGADAAQLLTATRAEALGRLAQAASDIGASAVIGVQINSAAIADLTEVAAYGTGVVTERE